MEQRKSLGLTNNQLKIIAMVAMVLDHVGLQLFPHIMALRYIGRLAFPIFAFMIAEGCSHTHHKGKYLLSVALMGAACQIVYAVAMDSLYMNVLITFTLSILVIYSIDLLLDRRTLLSAAPLVLCVATVVICCTVLPQLLSGTDYSIDYGIFGVALPVMVYYAPTRPTKLAACALSLVGLVFTRGLWQLWAFPAILLLAAYNGERGRLRMKYVFYLFYPAHLVIIWLIGLVI